MVERRLFSGDLVSISEFSCPSGDRAWRELNVIASAGPIVVFPRLPVVIRHAGAEPVLATPNLVMIYNPGQPYERALRDERGDDCLFIELHEPALRALAEETGAAREGRLLARHAPAHRVAYFRQHLLGRYLHERAPDPLLVEETAAALVRAVVTAAVPPAGARRRTTRASHHELAEAAKELVAASPAAPLGLQEIACRLGVSAFHLARVFRRETGFSLHQYRTQLRLRLALRRLPESRGSLTALAFELGFASHSHFTDTFRRGFGVAPSAVRDAAQVEPLLLAA